MSDGGVPTDEESNSGAPLIKNKSSVPHQHSFQNLEAANRKKNAIIAILLVLIVAAVAIIVVLATQGQMTPPSSPSNPEALVALAHNVTSSMNTSVNPCENFYEYACGQWLVNNPIPGDHSSWGRSFSTIHERTLTQLQEILESGSKMESHFYRSCMDETRVEQRELEGLQPILDLIDTEITQKPALMVASSLMKAGVGSIFLSVGAQVDVKNPKNYTLACSQGGLGLPNKKYYTEDAQATVRAAYVTHISNMLTLSKISSDTATDLANKILSFETKLAQGSLLPEEMRDPENLYNKKTIESLDVQFPELKWTEFFTDLLTPHYDVKKDSTIIVEVPQFMTALGQAINSADQDTLRAYMRFHTLHSYSSHLNSAFRNETFDFYSKRLAGQEKQAPRWKKCISMTDANLPDAVGETYSREYFGSHAKTRVEALITDVEAAFAEMLRNVEWMDPVTQKRAKTKLDMLANNVGYPDHTVDYSPLQDRIGSELLDNARAVREFEIARNFKKIGQEVDRGEWEMSAATVNAYYDPSKNIMVFPAAILQAPFFDISLPPAMNYGSVGAVMGHELTHAFDDEGRKYNGEGRLIDWWENSTIANFENTTKCIENEFNQFPVPGAQDGSKISGKLTLGENIADLGGLKAAYYAYKKHKQTRNHVTAALDFPPPFHFLTEDQLFFVSFAQSWCENVRDEYSVLLAKNDPHSPPMYRVKGTLSNLVEFAEAFECPDPSAYVRTGADRCQVW